MEGQGMFMKFPMVWAGELTRHVSYSRMCYSTSHYCIMVKSTGRGIRHPGFNLSEQVYFQSQFSQQD